MPPAQTPSALLQAALEQDPGAPLLTFYDDGTGERVELSVATFANWVAKTANLLQDGLAAAPGERAALLLPGHWQTAVWLFACWSAGVVAVPGGDPETADVVACGPESLDAASAARPPALVALSLRPLGARMPALPPGAIDYADVLGFPDTFAPHAPVSADAPALEVAGARWSAADLVTGAQRLADEWALGRGDRLLVAAGFDTAGAVLAGLLAPLSRGVGIVLCRHLDEALLARRADSERVTGVVGRVPPAGTLLRFLPITS